MMQRGRQHAAKAEWLLALEAFRAVQAAAPDRAGAALEAARVLVRLQRLDEAEETCRRLLSRADPGTAFAARVLATLITTLLEQAQLASRRGDPDARRRHLDAAAALAPNHPGVLGQQRLDRRAERRFDWRDEVRASLRVLKEPSAAEHELVAACGYLVTYGIVGPVEPVLQRFGATNRRARQILAEMRQVVRLGLAAPMPGAADDDAEREHLNQLRGSVEKLAPPAKTLVLVFAGGAQQVYLSIDLFHRILRPAGVNIIYLRDLENLMFLGGVVGLGDIDQTIAALRQRAIELGTDRLLVIGNSSGSAGALRYGLALGAEAILALGPRLNVPRDEQLLAHQLARKRAAPPARQQFLRNVGDLYRAAPSKPRVTLIYGDRCLADVDDARDLEGVDGVIHAPVTGFDAHACAGMLLAAGLLAPILRNFVEHGAVASELLEKARNAYRDVHPGLPA
jgi:tetratricopeptide (TPR) repeat protein